TYRPRKYRPSPPAAAGGEDWQNLFGLSENNPADTRNVRPPKPRTALLYFYSSRKRLRLSCLRILQYSAEKRLYSLFPKTPLLRPGGCVLKLSDFRLSFSPP